MVKIVVSYCVVSKQVEVSIILVSVPLKSIDAKHISEELVTIMTKMGIPKEILTDQGSNFTSKLLTEVYRPLHLNTLRTSPYHPQTDDLVERFNKMLKDMLRKTAGVVYCNFSCMHITYLALSITIYLYSTLGSKQPLNLFDI